MADTIVGAANLVVRRAGVRAVGRVDRTRLEATTEADMDRHAAEDDAVPADDQWYPEPGSLRRQLGLSQPAMAELLHVPVATWRNWEQSRVSLDPAVKTLLRVVLREPDAVRRALDGRAA